MFIDGIISFPIYPYYDDIAPYVPSLRIILLLSLFFYFQPPMTCAVVFSLLI